MDYKIYPNLTDIFELEDVDYNQVVIKVKADTPLKVAKFPFVSGNYEYITVTRGGNHILTVIHKDGHTFSFSWGNGGYTLISDELKLLKRNILAFIENNDIIIAYDGSPVTKASIYYNDSFKCWQLSLDGQGNYWNHEVNSAEEMIEYCKRFVTAKWEFGKAQTGIDIWRTIEPKFALK